MSATDPDADRPDADRPARPVELLSFSMNPAHVETFVEADHRVWTTGLAQHGNGASPIISKEIWLDDADPGIVHVIIVWESTTHWNDIPATLLEELAGLFAEAFPHPHRLVAERSITGKRLRQRRHWHRDLAL